MSATGDSFEALLRAVADSPAISPPFRGDERYELGAKLGEGGFGAVYACFDRRRGAHVALKVLRASDPAALYRFKREFRALADLTHPNVVRLYELESRDTTTFFTMELVAGVPFLRWAAASEERLRGALAGVTRGLVALHGAGKLHRDLKPSNVLVTAEGRAVLLDFGLVGSTSGERSLVFAGTPHYMAPEQACGALLGPACDWYAVGVMLFEALTGTLPFRGEPADVLAQKQRDEAPDVRALAPQAPADLAALCARLLARDPAARPTDEELLGHWDAHPVAPSTPEGETFVGRGPELARFARELEAMSGGAARVLFVHGPSGVGKSALLGRMLALARLRLPDVVVLAGRCHAHESLRYKAFDAAMDELTRLVALRPPAEIAALLPRDLAALARLFPVTGRLGALSRLDERAVQASDADARRRGVLALRELFGRLGDRHPVVLCVDDLQWGDADSAELFAELVRPPDAPRLLLVGSYRSAERESPLLTALGPRLAELGAGVPVTSLELAELDAGEALALAQSLLAELGRDPTLASGVAAESRGHPFFLAELVRAARPHGAPRVDELVAERTRALAPPARRLLEVLAVAGAPLASGACAAAAELGDELLPALAALRAERLARVVLGPEGDALEPYHDRIREVVCDGLAASATGALHGHIAAALAADPACSPERVAGHVKAAGEPARAARLFEVAARRALDALAFEHAVDLFREARALRKRAGVTDSERELCRKLGEACAGAGRCSEAADAFLAAAAAASGLEALDLRQRALAALLVGGYLEQSRALLGELLAALGMRPPLSVWRALALLVANRVRLSLPRRRVRARPASELPPEELLRIDTLWAAGLGLAVISPVVGAALLSEHALAAFRAGEVTRMLQATCAEAMISSIRGLAGAEATARSLAAARELAARIGSEDAASLVATIEAGVGLWQGRLGYALEAAERALAQRRAAGFGSEAVRAECFKHNALFLMGRVGDAARELPDLVQAMQARGNLLGFTWLSLYVCWAAMARDEPAARAHAHIERALAPWKLRGVELQLWWRVYAHIYVDLYWGDGRAAAEALDAVWPALARALLLESQMHRIEARWIRARTRLARALVEPARAGALALEAEADIGRIEKERTGWGDALALELRAGVALARGERPAALRLLARAEPVLWAHGFESCAVAAEYTRAALLGGDEGRRLRQKADAWLSRQDVAVPSRWCALYLPVPRL